MKIKDAYFEKNSALYFQFGDRGIYSYTDSFFGIREMIGSEIFVDYDVKWNNPALPGWDGEIKSNSFSMVYEDGF